VLLTGFPGAEAVHAHQIQNDRVVDDAIDGRHRRHRIFENAVPVRENEVRRDGHTTALVALRLELLAAKRDLRLPRLLAKLDRFECVFLDDHGYVQHDRDEMEVLFTFLKRPSHPAFCATRVHSPAAV